MFHPLTPNLPDDMGDELIESKSNVGPHPEHLPQFLLVDGLLHTAVQEIFNEGEEVRVVVFHR